MLMRLDEFDQVAEPNPLLTFLSGYTQDELGENKAECRILIDNLINSTATPISELTAAWNDGGNVFTGIGLHVDNQASSPYSSLLTLGDKDGEVLTPFLRFLASNKLELYKMYGDETNYERLQFYWTTGGFPDAMVIEAQYDGTGTGKDIRLQAHGDKYINIGAGGVTINTLTRFGYHAKVATGLQLIFEDGGGDNVYIDSPANDMIRLRGGDAAGAAIHFPVITTPPSAPASGFILYSDISGGKTRAMVIFPSGVAQQFAIEP